MQELERAHPCLGGYREPWGTLVGMGSPGRMASKLKLPGGWEWRAEGGGLENN